jgi:hypothetical protein
MTHDRLVIGRNDVKRKGRGVVCASKAYAEQGVNGRVRVRIIIRIRVRVRIRA